MYVVSIYVGVTKSLSDAELDAKCIANSLLISFLLDIHSVSHCGV